MNALQRLVAKNFLPSLYAKALQLQQNALFRATYQYVGQNVPVFPADNPHTYTHSAYAGNADVYAIVNYIATTASTIPWALYGQKGGKKTKIENHPVLTLLHRPNPATGKALFVEQALGYKLLTGNSYLYGISAENGINAGKMLQLYVLPAHLVQIVGGGLFAPVSGYKLTSMLNEVIAPEKVLHLRYFNPATDSINDPYGMAPIRALIKTLANSNDAYTATSQAYQNMGALGILSRESGNTDEFTPDQASALEERWQRKFGGAHNYGKIVMTGAQVKWQQFGLSPVDLNILQSLQLSFRKLCNGYKFPAVLLNDTEKSTYNNVKEAKKALYTDCVLPELEAFRDELNRWLLPAYGENIWLDIDTSGIEVLQQEKKEMVSWLVDAWWLTGNERRQVMEMDVLPDPEMNQVYLPANLTPIKEPEAETDIDLTALAQNGVQDYN